MIAVVTKATKVPIQENPGPMTLPKDPITPSLVFLPKEISMMRRGIDHNKRKRSQAIMKAPPPCWETIRGKRHIFPVPTAIPIPAKIIPQRDAKSSFFSMVSIAQLPFLRANNQERMNTASLDIFSSKGQQLPFLVEQFKNMLLGRDKKRVVLREYAQNIFWKNKIPISD